MKADKELAGTVTSIKLSNPHGSLALAVNNPDGSTTEWVMTLGSAHGPRACEWQSLPQRNLRRGLSQTCRHRPCSINPRRGSPTGSLI